MHQIREMNKFETVIGEKIQYVLEDSTVIAIDTETQHTLNSILKPDVIDYMRENSDNFLKILNVILEEN